MRKDLADVGIQVYRCWKEEGVSVVADIDLCYRIKHLNYNEKVGRIDEILWRIRDINRWLWSEQLVAIGE